MGVANAAELLNLVGFLIGAALCAMLLVLVRRGRTIGERQDRLPLLHGACSAWPGISGELADYLLSRAAVPGPEPWLNVISFAALAVLAAVVVHSVARGVTRGRAIIVAAYACSVAAIGIHVATVARGDLGPSATAFTMLTVAFGVISVPLAIATRSQTNGRRALWMLALALFAVSANHLGHFHDEAGGWLAELLGHHAVLPLAFAILYQEYRFALADLFLKRALTLLAVVAIAMAAYAAIASVPPGSLAVSAAARRLGTDRRALSGAAPGRVAVRRLGAAAAAKTTARLRSRARAGAAARATQSTVCSIGPPQPWATAMNARRAWWADAAAPVAADARITAEIAVPDQRSARRSCCGSATLVGGRRLLSDDRAFLEAAALAAARRIDAVRLSHERFDQRIRAGGDGAARRRSRAAGAALADQPALPVQRADDDRLSDRDRAGAGDQDACCG